MKIASLVSWLPMWLALVWKSAAGFTANHHHQYQPRQCSRVFQLAAAASDWENLIEDNSFVRKCLLEASSDTNKPTEGSTVTIEYTGSLWMDPKDDSGCSIPCWDTQSVVDCWLSQQQGLDTMKDKFEELDITGATLLDPELFTEAFVADQLGVQNKIQCKKTIMAAKRLRSTLDDYEHGHVFDSTADKPNGTYSFVLGAGKTIRAMELLVASMQIGETSRVVARCDFGYGADGCRTSKGDVLVPPFCALQFDVKLVSVE